MIDGLTKGGSLASYDLSRIGSVIDGPNLKPPNNISFLVQPWPSPNATIDLDFVNNQGWIQGSGQGKALDPLSYTRASNATWVNSSGLLEPSNNSFNKFSNTNYIGGVGSSWNVRGGTTVSVRAELSPINTPDASVVNNVSGDGYIWIFPASGFWKASTTYTMSVYVKSLIGSPILKFNAYWVVGSPTNVTSGNNNVTSSWNRYSYTFTTASSVADGGDTGIYITGGSAAIWGIQLEEGSTMTDYLPNDSNYNLPRFDWGNNSIQYRRNKFTYSEDFSNSVWYTSAYSQVTTNLTVTPNAITGPFSGTQATLVVLNNGTSGDPNTSKLFRSLGGSFNFIATTNTIYIKYAGIDKVRLYHGNAQGNPEPNIATGVEYTFSTDTVTGLSGNTGSNKIVSRELLSEGWVRIRLTRPTGDGSSGTGGWWFTFTSAVTGNGVDGVYVYGAQIEYSSEPTDYQVNGLSLVDYTILAATSSINGLLVEPQATNRLLWCRDLTKSSWAATNVTVLRDQIGVDGIQNTSTRLLSTDNNGTCTQSLTLASGTRTVSMFMKRITGTGQVQVTLDGTTWSSVELSSTEWRRMVFTGTVTNPIIGIKIFNSGDSIAIDYVQLEDGSFATSPIFTTTSASTRSADFASKPVTGDFYNFNECTIYTEFRNSYITSSNYHSGCGFEFYRSGQNNMIYFNSRRDGPFYRNGRIGYFSGTTYNEVGTAGSSNNLTDPTVFLKFAGSVSHKEMSFSYGGLPSGTVVGFSIAPLPTTFAIGSNNYYYNGFCGHIKRIIYVPKAISGEILSEITK